MLMTTTDAIPGREIEEPLGLVSANAVGSLVTLEILMAGQNLVGGEIEAYRQLLFESREQAVGELEAQVREIGGDAVVGLRMATASIAQGAAEILVYGSGPFRLRATGS